MSLSLKENPTLHIYNSVLTTGPDFCQDLIISILKPCHKSCHKHVKNKPKIYTHIYRNSEVDYGWLVVGLKVYLHSFSLVIYYSHEVCVTVQEMAPPSLKTWQEKVEALPCYLIHLLRQCCKVVSKEILQLDCLGTKSSFTTYCVI